MAYVVYTSGTSGKATRGGPCPPGNLGASDDGRWAGTACGKATVLCHAGAFNWTYTLGTGLMDPWTIGATALIPEARNRVLTALPGLLRQHRATIFAAAPGVYRKMLQGGDTSGPAGSAPWSERRVRNCRGTCMSMGQQGHRDRVVRGLWHVRMLDLHLIQPGPPRARRRAGAAATGAPRWRSWGLTARYRRGRKAPSPFIALTPA